MQIRNDSLFARGSTGLDRSHFYRTPGNDPNAIETSFSSTLARSKDADKSGGSFLELIGKGVGKVNEMQQTANANVEQMLTGGDIQSAEVFSGLQKADMAFRLLVQVRNKLMQAYEEINGIRV